MSEDFLFKYTVGIRDGRYTGKSVLSKGCSESDQHQAVLVPSVRLNLWDSHMFAVENREIRAQMAVGSAGAAGRGVAGALRLGAAGCRLRSSGHGGHAGRHRSGHAYNVDYHTRPARLRREAQGFARIGRQEDYQRYRVVCLQDYAQRGEYYCRRLRAAQLFSSHSPRGLKGFLCRGFFVCDHSSRDLLDLRERLKLYEDR